MNIESNYKNQLVDSEELQLPLLLLEKEIQKASLLYNHNLEEPLLETNENIFPSNSTELFQRVINTCMYLTDYSMKVLFIYFSLKKN